MNSNTNDLQVSKNSRTMVERVGEQEMWNSGHMIAMSTDSYEEIVPIPRDPEVDSRLPKGSAVGCSSEGKKLQGAKSLPQEATAAARSGENERNTHEPAAAASAVLRGGNPTGGSTVRAGSKVEQQNDVETSSNSADENVTDEWGVVSRRR